MNLYEINTAIFNLIDEETGEVKDYEAFEQLNMQRDEKIESIALWVKDLNAEAAAIREEEKKLAERRKACENKSERLKSYVAYALDGQAFKTARVSLTFRNTKSVEVDDNFIEWAKRNGRYDLLKVYEPTADKIALKDKMADGEEFEFARIHEKKSLIMK